MRISASPACAVALLVAASAAASDYDCLIEARQQVEIR